MRRTAWLALLATVVVAMTLLLLLMRGAREHRALLPVSDRIEYYKLYVDLSKAVLVGFSAALLGILIPAVLAETRHSFERLRDSRTAYSEAKTSVDYLPLRICTLDLRAAGALVQRAHVRKHEAELYSELRQHLRRRGILLSPDQWGDELYNRLFAIRSVLEAHAADWDKLTTVERLAALRAKVPSPPKETSG